MSHKALMTLIGIAIAASLFTLPGAVAQPAPVAQPNPPTVPVPHMRRRIEITPRPLLYRRCIDWYELQHRPSGTVLYPQMRCWWVRG